MTLNVGGRGRTSKGNDGSNLMKGQSSGIEELVQAFKPEDFLSANDKISVRSLDLLKRLYDLTKSLENKGSLEDPLGLHTETLKIPLNQRKKKKRQAKLSKTEAPLTRLITKDFDEDQIWEEVELQNGLLYDNLVTSVSKLLAYKDKSVNEADSEEEDLLEDDTNPMHNKPADDEDSDFFESDEKYRKKTIQQAKDGKQYPKSIVDDKFFSLAQMTEHIEQVEAEMEKAETKRSTPVNEADEQESSSDEDSVDMFEDVPSDQEEEQESPEYYYKDFFDPPLDGSDNNVTSEIDLEQELQSDEELDVDVPPSFDHKKSVRFSLEQEDVENDDDADVGGVESDEDPIISKPDTQLGKKINETLSTFEKRKKKIQENIEEIENEALKPKSWQLLGEATAENRPENALLEEHLIYDHLIRPAPEITVETTQRLEDVIKRRIKDGAWDDVQRKVKPVEDPRDYKKRLVLDAEKSKASLADIYEKEYLDQKKVEEGEVEEKEPEEHVQIKKELHSLFTKLDALSHYHFTPKPATAEIKLVAHSSVITMEDVAPVNVSDANMLAPQEIEDNIKGPMKGKDERSETDRKRERRKKKKKQHLKRLLHEEKAQMKGLGLKNIKLADGIVKAQQKAKEAKGEHSSHHNSKELKSSKAFFAKLQESVTSHISNVAKRKNISKNREKMSAKKFKL